MAKSKLECPWCHKLVSKRGYSCSKLCHDALKESDVIRKKIERHNRRHNG